MLTNKYYAKASFDVGVVRSLCPLLGGQLTQTASMVSSSQIPLAVIWVNFGPYHLARIRALTPQFDVAAIELARFERLYSWRAERVGISARFCTLRAGDWEDQQEFPVAVSLWRTLNSLKPKVVLIPGYTTLPALTAALWGKLHRARTILMSDSNSTDHPRNPLREFIKKTIVQLLYDCAIVAGNRAKQYANNLGVDDTRIGIGYDVVDNTFFSRETKSIRVAAIRNPSAWCSNYFLYVGRLAPEKNLFTLIRAFARYRTSGGRWRLLLVGDGPLRQSLQREVVEQSCEEHVTFSGRKNIHELASFYALAGCFILPSTREPWGLVVNEAMASGLPIIVSTRCGCVDDLVEEGCNGFTFDPSSPDSLAILLSRISALSNTERAALGLRSEEIIARYTPELWASEVFRIAAIRAGVCTGSVN